MPAVDPATKAPVMDPATASRRSTGCPRPTIACATNASARPAHPHDDPDGEGLPRGRDGVPPHQPPARLPDLRPGRRMQAAGAVDRLRPGLHPLHRAEEREAEADAARPARHAGRRALHPVLALHPLLARRSPRTTCSASSTAAATARSPAIPGKKLENNYSLNTVDICPVGALTSTDFRFKMRVWFLKETNSIDTESSVGREHRRLVARGRRSTGSPRARTTRSTTPGWPTAGGCSTSRSARPAAWPPCGSTAPRAPSTSRSAPAAELLAAGGVAVVGSGRSSVEEQFLTAEARRPRPRRRRMARLPGGEGGRPPHLRPTATRTCAARSVTGLISALPAAEPRARSARQIDAGSVRTVVSVGEDLAAAGPQRRAARQGVGHLPGDPRQRDQRRRPGRHPDPHRLREARHLREPAVPDPALRQGRARPPPGRPTTSSSWRRLVAAAGGPVLGADVGALWAAIAAEVPALGHDELRQHPGHRPPPRRRRPGPACRSPRARRCTSSRPRQRRRRPWLISSSSFPLVVQAVAKGLAGRPRGLPGRGRLLDGGAQGLRLDPGPARARTAPCRPSSPGSRASASSSASGSSSSRPTGPSSSSRRSRSRTT